MAKPATPPAPHPNLNLYTRSDPFTVRFDPSLPRGMKSYFLLNSLVRTCPLGETAMHAWDEIRLSPLDSWVWPDGEGFYLNSSSRPSPFVRK